MVAKRSLCMVLAVLMMLSALPMAVNAESEAEATAAPAEEIIATEAPEDTAEPEPVATEEPEPVVTEEPAPEATEEPAPEATEEPAPEATEEPEPEATAEPEPEATEEPAPEATEEPAPEATEEPAPEATEEPAPEATEEPAPEATAEPEPEATAEPEPEATEEPAPEATAEPAPEATAEPAPEATEEPAPEATEEPKPEATAEPSDEVMPAIDYAGCGDCGADLWWGLTLSGTVIINGTGPMDDYSMDGGPWCNNPYAEVKEVVIGEGVTSIGVSAFRSCVSLTSVTIPESVTSIGAWAFCWCYGLTDVSLPASLTDIGEEAFSGTPWLNNKGNFHVVNGVLLSCVCSGSVMVPDDVTTIGTCAFEGCYGLWCVTLPAGVTGVRERAFDGCPALERVDVVADNDHFTSVDGVLFDRDKKQLIYYPLGKGKTAYTVPDGVTSIWPYAFNECTVLTNVTLPASLTGIGKSAFYGCTGLTGVTFPGGLTSIGDYAFDGCTGLASVTLPGSLTSIGASVFYGCTALTSVTLQNGVKSTGNGTFQNCHSLTSLTLPASLTSIGGGAFGDCDSLTNVTIPGNVESIGENAFGYCEKLASLTIPGSVKSIEDWAFVDCYGLTSLTIQNGLTSIGYEAFYGCTSLPSVTLPASVKSIGDGAFAYNNKMTSLTVMDPACVIGGGDEFGETLGVPGTTTIYGYTGSTAETYAKGHGFAFTALPTPPTPAPDEKLPAPVISKISNVANGISLTWKKVSGASKYRVYYRKAGASSWTRAIDTTKTSYVLTKVTGGTKYNIRVVCISDDQQSIISAYSATKTYTFIKPPKITQVKNINGGIKVTWGKSAGATRYRIYYKVAGASKWNSNTLTGTTFTLKGAKSGTSYTFLVRCVSKTGGLTSYYDATKTIKYIAAPKVTLSNRANGIKISWGKVTGAAKYRVYYQKAGASKWTRAIDTAKTSYTLTKVTGGTKYNIRVVCISKDQQSIVSGYSTMKTYTFIKPPTLKSLTKTSSGIKATWSKSAGAARYRLYVKVAGSSKWSMATNTTSTSYVWKNARHGTTYTFMVRCVTKNGKTLTSYYNGTKSIRY